MALCQCGCGQPTKIASTTSRRNGYIRGEPLRFLHGHCGHHKGERAVRWSGGRVDHGDGYKKVQMPGHPRAHNGYVLEHIAVAEAALGKYLPDGAEVHHVDGDPGRNVGENLVVCQDHAYHWLLEIRTRALRVCGDPNKRRCKYCKQYDGQSALEHVHTGRGNKYHHRECRRKYISEYHARRKSRVIETIGPENGAQESK
jgi:hypothetical protein